MKPCEHCPVPAVRGERFCRRHRNKLFQNMKRDDYLTQVPRLSWDDTSIVEQFNLTYLTRSIPELEAAGKVVRIF